MLAKSNPLSRVHLLAKLVACALPFAALDAFAQLPPSDAYSPGDPQDNPNTPISKLGPVLAWQALQSDQGLVQRGSLLLTAQWYLSHRYRTGGTTNGALPFLGLGLVFSGDLVRRAQP